MPSCQHQCCGHERRVWVPMDHLQYSEVRAHPWCIQCGEIKNISDDQGKKLGYWLNILSRISRKFPITQVQRRLISKKLSDHTDFQNLFGITGSHQKKAFIQIINQHTNIAQKDLETVIY
ncbi:MAG: hypothetical protein R6U21_06250 [Thermoplasmatota archaeon]